MHIARSLIIVLMILVVFSAGFFALKKTKAKDVCGQLISALQDGNPSTAYELLTPAAQQTEGTTNWNSKVADLKISLEGKKKLIDTQPLPQFTNSSDDGVSISYSIGEDKSFSCYVKSVADKKAVQSFVLNK